MFTLWSTMTFVLLPPALLILFLLTVPLPGSLNRAVVKLVEFIFALHIGTIRIFAAITFISFVVLVAETFDLQRRYSKGSTSKITVELGMSADLQSKASRWRAERNWWITALTFLIYWMLLRFHALKKQLIVELQRQR